MRYSQMNGNWNKIERQLNRIINSTTSNPKNNPIQFVKKESVSGGCINQAWKVTDNNNRNYFVKTNAVELKDMFIAEANALNELQKSNSIRTPKVLTAECTPELCYLVLEYIPLKSPINQKQMGKQLAQMHRLTNSTNQFGWTQNNFIGSTPQSNQTHDDWVSFWENERLLYQLKLARNNGYTSSAYDAGLKLAECLSLFFTDYQPKPSLLHGDLWGGNCASDTEGNPVIYDPATYYGDREADIAMTELFGGFDAEFYRAYNENYALDDGYKIRKPLYNLYHILNHFNLFGDGYARQAESMTRQLLSEI